MNWVDEKAHVHSHDTWNCAEVFFSTPLSQTKMQEGLHLLKLCGLH